MLQLLPRPHNRRRLKYLLATLLAVSLMLAARLYYLSLTTYAFTFSLGNGYGFVVYTKLYDELPPVLQESVRFHEGVHLQDGTFEFWSNSCELRAYGEQIKEIKRQKSELSKLYRTTHLAKYARDYYELSWFQTIMEETMREYSK